MAAPGHAPGHTISLLGCCFGLGGTALATVDQPFRVQLRPPEGKRGERQRGQGRAEVSRGEQSRAEQRPTCARQPSSVDQRVSCGSAAGCQRVSQLIR